MFAWSPEKHMFSIGVTQHGVLGAESGIRILDPEFRTLEPGSRIMDPGSGSWIQNPGSRVLDPDPSYEASTKLGVLPTKFRRSFNEVRGPSYEVSTKLGVLPTKFRRSQGSPKDKIGFQ